MLSTALPKVLVVDDDPLVRDLLVQVIGESGYSADDAEDGETALAKMSGGRYDAVFTDLMMPRMGGMDLLRRLKVINPSVPVIVITGFPSMETGISALKEGATDFVTKPFRLNEIKLLLDKLVRKSRLEQDSQAGGGHNFLDVVNEKLYEKVKHISMLSYINESISEIRENSRLMDWVAHTARDLTGAGEVTVGFIEEDRFVVRRALGVSSGLVVKFAGTAMAEAQRTKSCCQSPPGVPSPYGVYTLLSGFLSVPLIIRDEVIGFLNLSGKSDGSTFTDEEAQLAAALAEKMVLRFENNALYESLYTNFIDTLKALVSTIGARDSYTKEHSERVTRYALEMAQIVGLSDEESDAIRFACYLHDIGKIGVRDTVLLKPGRLTVEEFADIRQHPIIGDSIVQSLAFLPLERAIIRHHHERWDGLGYPDGIGGDGIPLLARLVAVADTYDALTTMRPYRNPQGHEFAIRELITYSGSQFDPAMVDAFLRTETGRNGPRC
ncbi:MAG: response regulator [Nitrospirae bacterium]|jgi:putative nucleotidyltransferase with HDIG domain|nr:response regulator [Nitrospirota bacterium]